MGRMEIAMKLSKLVFQKVRNPFCPLPPLPSHFYLKEKRPLFDRPSSGPSFEIAPRAGRCKEKKKNPTAFFFFLTLGELFFFFSLWKNKSTMKQSDGRSRRRRRGTQQQVTEQWQKRRGEKSGLRKVLSPSRLWSLSSRLFSFWLFSFSTVFTAAATLPLVWHQSLCVCASCLLALAFLCTSLPDHCSLLRWWPDTWNFLSTLSLSPLSHGAARHTNTEKIEKKRGPYLAATSCFPTVKIPPAYKHIIIFTIIFYLKSLTHGFECTRVYSKDSKKRSVTPDRVTHVHSHTMHWHFFSSFFAYSSLFTRLLLLLFEWPIH